MRAGVFDNSSLTIQKGSVLRYKLKDVTGVNPDSLPPGTVVRVYPELQYDDIDGKDPGTDGCTSISKPYWADASNSW